MKANEPSVQETDGCTDLEVTVCENGVVNIHRPESDRTHSVFVGAGGSVLRCSCKGHHYRGECAHADAIEKRPLVTASAQAAASAPKRVATDGGRVETAETGADTDDGEERGTVDAHGCSTCSGYAYGDDDQCPECQQRGVSPVNEAPL